MDNQSTIDIFSNPNFLTNIRKENVQMQVRSTGGGLTTRICGDFSNYSRVWFSKRGMVNILSFQNVVKKFRVTYDSNTEDAFIVHTSIRKKLKFIPSLRGLYYLDVASKFFKKGASLAAGGFEFVIVHTVAENIKQFLKR